MFAVLPDGLLANLTPADLQTLLLGRVMDGAVAAAAVGHALVFVVEGTDLVVSGVRVANADVTVSNGVIHVIDAVGHRPPLRPRTMLRSRARILTRGMCVGKPFHVSAYVVPRR